VHYQFGDLVGHGYCLASAPNRTDKEILSRVAIKDRDNTSCGGWKQQVVILGLGNDRAQAGWL